MDDSARHATKPDWLPDRIGTWIDPALAGTLATLSLVLFLAGVLLVPLLIARLPADYFVRDRHSAPPGRRPLLRMARLILQNAAGALLLFAGLAMLVLPGQGLLTILVALSMLTFPGKRRAQRWVLERPAVARVVQAIRRRAGREPLRLT